MPLFLIGFWKKNSLTFKKSSAKVIFLLLQYVFSLFWEVMPKILLLCLSLRSLFTEIGTF